ncbi:MAG: ribosomal L7Ae/L30e/S12e/Gadd45 family protein [Oscillospiraceae bacterium]|nr:ribosomal L7Ae/L30e/S12e/Gadd45 family protein [Oscillospiraceae bacterium]
MLTEFASAKPIVGLKQSKKAVTCGLAQKAFIAGNADPDITEAFALVCEENKVPVVYADSMEELGRACGINVGAAVAVLLNKHIL